MCEKLAVEVDYEDDTNIWYGIVIGEDDRVVWLSNGYGSEDMARIAAWGYIDSQYDMATTA